MKHTTSIPNIVFDTYLKILKPSEAVVLLVVFRQTLGWLDPLTKKRKRRDWISLKQFISKTGLSNSTITKAIQRLIELRLIVATDAWGKVLDYPQSRKSQGKVFYGPRFRAKESQ